MIKTQKGLHAELDEQQSLLQTKDDALVVAETRINQLQSGLKENEERDNLQSKIIDNQQTVIERLETSVSNLERDKAALDV